MSTIGQHFDTPTAPVKAASNENSIDNNLKYANAVQDGVEQSLNFNATHRINAGEKVADGYRDAGRRVRFDENGRITNPDAIYRETIVVNRAKDQKLQALIDDIKSKTANMNEKQKAQYLQDYIYRLTGDDGIALRNNHIWQEQNIGQDVLLGDIVTNNPPIAVCRHRSLLYKILGDEIGLNVELQRGNFYLRNGYGGGHAWNTVTFSDGTRNIFDAMHNRSSSITPGNVDDYARYYYDVMHQALYN